MHTKKIPKQNNPSSMWCLFTSDSFTENGNQAKFKQGIEDYKQPNTAPKLSLNKDTKRHNSKCKTVISKCVLKTYPTILVVFQQSGISPK